jgi:AbrB family looped-hinge helix DNA binding protein
MNQIIEAAQMTLMRVRRAAQLTLPAEVRRALNVQEGDFLEAEIVKDGVLLKPVAVVQRARAWERIKEAASHVIDREPNPDEDIKAEEEAIAESVKEFRRKHA